jgi:predicted Rossmann-fold nucleotide-binding protein
LGTLEEIFEILTWAQLGLHRKPCGFLNVEGYFDPLLAFLDQAVARRFVKEKHRGLLLTAPSVPELLGLLTRFRPPEAEKWINPGET